MRHLLIMITLLLLLSSGISAQGRDDTPLIWQTDQTVFIQRGEVDRYKDCQPAEEIVSPLFLSTDGRHFVMATHPAEVTLKLEEFGGVGGGPMPHNFWLCDIQTNTLYWIADQPEDFTFLEQGRPEYMVTRSEPAWSPGGTELIWTEQRIGPMPVSTVMVIYDTVQHLSREIDLAMLPESIGIGVPYEPLWGDAGIITVGIGLDPASDDYTLVETVYVLDLAGNITVSWVLNEAAMIYYRFLVRDNSGQQWLGMYHREQGWLIADVMSGEIQPMNGLPELYSLSAPNSSSLVMDISPDGSPAWRWINSTTEPLFTYVNRQRITLSPDGRALAVGIDEIDIWSDIEIETVPFTQAFGDDFSASLIWGVVDWRIRTGAPRIFDQAVQCPGTPPSRLITGTQGRVIPGTSANNVRSEAGLDGAVIGQIPAGALFIVLSAPVCADRHIWYQVDYNGLVGWTAESSESEYWIEPLP